MSNDREPRPAPTPDRSDPLHASRATHPRDHIAKDAPAPSISAARKTSAELDAESAEERATRAAYVEQYRMVADLGFDTITTAIDRVSRTVSVPEQVKQSAWRDTLRTAADIALVATASGFGAWAAAAVMKKVHAAVLNNAVKETLKIAMKTATAAAMQDAHGGGANSPTVVDAYVGTLESNLLRAKAAFAKHWPTVATHLYKLSTAELQSASESEIDDVDQLARVAERSMLVEWTNFVARSIHGPMQSNALGTEPRGSSVPLEGAAPGRVDAKQPDPAGGNLDPQRFLWGVDTDSPRNEGEYYGVLQVHVWSDGTLVELENYGMRLDHVGPSVRAKLREYAGLLRNTPMNKVVKVYARHPDNNVAPKPMHGFLITADNHIRRSYNKLESNVDVAERVQEMSLARLGG